MGISVFKFQNFHVLATRFLIFLTISLVTI